MASTDTEGRPRIQLSAEATRALAAYTVVRELDRLGHPHLLLKVPDLEKAAQADIGVEVARDDAGRVTLSVLLYDIPTEPVSYDLRFWPGDQEDLRFLQSFLEAGQFRVHPCSSQAGGAWAVGPTQTFRLPTDVLLRLRHFSRDWPARDEPAARESEPRDAGGAEPVGRSPDPRDTVIRKLKEQVQALREQLQERDKRIIELEDELHALRSRGRGYKLSGEKRPWWKPFS
jgi:hypothetical protein